MNADERFQDRMTILELLKKESPSLRRILGSCVILVTNKDHAVFYFLNEADAQAASASQELKRRTTKKITCYPVPEVNPVTRWAMARGATIQRISHGELAEGEPI